MQFCTECNVFLLWNNYIFTQCILCNKYLLLCNVKNNSRRRRNNHALMQSFTTHHPTNAVGCYFLQETTDHRKKE